MLLIPAAAAPLQAADRRLLAASDSQTGGNDLNVAQASIELGWSVPVVFGKREDGAGGVWMSPLASECRFENDPVNRVTASYLCVICAGQLPTILLGDIYQGDTPLLAGEFSQSYNARAAAWVPGNLIQQRFNVTTSYQEIKLEGGAIGDGDFLDISQYDTVELAEKIADAVAVGVIKSNGSHITSFNATVSKTVNWDKIGIWNGVAGPQFVGLAVAAGDEGGSSSVAHPEPKSTEYYESLSWSYSLSPNDPRTAAGMAPALYYAPGSYFYGLQFFASNRWVYDRADQGRCVDFSGYSITKPASTEPYGDIEINVTETIRGGFLMTQTDAIAGYTTGLLGGLAGVTYTITVNEENSEPYPKPEATLHCGTGGTYADLTTVSVTKQYPAENEGWRRHIHVFARNGTPVPRLIEGTAGSSNLFPDLAKYAMLQSQEIDASQIDNNLLLLSARFNAANAITCDGLAVAPANIAEWLDVMAPLFLLRPTNHNGKIGLRPAIPITDTYQFNTAPLVPVAAFNEANIIGPPSIQGIAAEDRRWQVGLLPRWREQPETNVGIIRASGPFRFNGVSDGSPVEVVDASEWVTRELHAVRLAALELARRRYVEHRATIQVEPSLAMAALAPGSIVSFSQAINPSVGRSGDWSYYYDLLSVSGPPLGPWTLELEHHPTDQTGASLLAQVVAAARIA